MMNRSKIFTRVLLCGLCVAGSTTASERLFTYTYEPETMPKGLFEFEQWITWRAGRNSAVGQGDYNRFEFREEFEYGVTDNYTLALYVNTDFTSYRDSAIDSHFSEYEWKGISLENIYMVLNPAEKPVGLSLYLEGTIGKGEAEVEEKLILGQRHGDWKWAFNLVHATEWEEDFEETEGELEADFGLTRILSPRWAVGLEVRGQSHIPDYREFEDFALYVGPVVSYRRDKWWVALTVMPQVHGANYDGNPDGNTNLDLVGHERVNTRLLFGFSF